MRRFAALYRELDRRTATSDKRAALAAYFGVAPAADAAWALWLLCGGRLGPRLARTRELAAWAGEAAGLAPWLVEECHAHVGDLAEALALLLGDAGAAPVDTPLAQWIEQRLLPLVDATEDLRRAAVLQAWRELDGDERLVFNKLLTGALRVGVSQRLVQQALAAMAGVDIGVIAQRMLGAWTPSPSFLRDLLSTQALPGDRRQPYPFFLASPLEATPAVLGDIADWQLEWKWDGIRLQLIRRQGEVALWSRGEERLDGRFPEIEAAARCLPRDAVLDGELLAWRDDAPLPFAALQKRIQRRRPGPRWLAEAPVRVVAYDLLEEAGADLRALPLQQRRARLAALLREAGDERLLLSPVLDAADWDSAAAARENARTRGVEGLMLKRRSSVYQAGRRRGDWWKWKSDPLRVDAVLLYAQPGSGRRSTLHTDYTFGLWEGESLVPVAKAYSGLSDAEILELDRWIRAHTRERFGPVRALEPVQVFELGFEAVQRSARHKSGVAVRFPRILRWRRDKPAGEADRLGALVALTADTDPATDPVSD